MVGKTLIDKDLKDLLSKEYLSNRKTTVGFPDFTDKQYLTDDNRKYMKMYRWLSPFYDITEKMVERFWSHHRITEMRRQLMDKLKWRNTLNISLNIRSLFERAKVGKNDYSLRARPGAEIGRASCRERV